MFNMDYVAKQTGSDVNVGGDVFMTETLTASATGDLTLSKVAVPIISGGSAYAWVKVASEASSDLEKKAVTGQTISGLTANTQYCVTYKYTNDAAKEIKVSAQFIPATLHAVLTVALYFGDGCNVESATKAGAVEIDIPRLQLSGAMELTMCTTCC